MHNNCHAKYGGHRVRQATRQSLVEKPCVQSDDPPSDRCDPLDHYFRTYRIGTGREPGGLTRAHLNGPAGFYRPTKGGVASCLYDSFEDPTDHSKFNTSQLSQVD